MALKLEKGQKINLNKSNGTSLKEFCIGLNWGAIEEKNKGFFGIGSGSRQVAVDLDASCVMIDSNKKVIDTISFRKLKSNDGSIIHSGDDRTGDVGGDDGLDNEILTIDLTKVNNSTQQIVFFLNSFKKQDFATIPFAHIRIYEGSKTVVKEVLATYNIASDSRFSGKVSMIMGKLYKKDGEWKFSAIGEATEDDSLDKTIQTILRIYS